MEQFPQPERQPAMIQLQPHGSSRRRILLIVAVVIVVALVAGAVVFGLVQSNQLRTALTGGGACYILLEDKSTLCWQAQSGQECNQAGGQYEFKKECVSGGQVAKKTVKGFVTTAEQQKQAEVACIQQLQMELQAEAAKQFKNLKILEPPTVTAQGFLPDGQYFVTCKALYVFESKPLPSSSGDPFTSPFPSPSGTVLPSIAPSPSPASSGGASPSPTATTTTTVAPTPSPSPTSTSTGYPYP